MDTILWAIQAVLSTIPSRHNDNFIVSPGFDLSSQRMDHLCIVLPGHQLLPREKDWLASRGPTYRFRKPTLNER